MDKPNDKQVDGQHYKGGNFQHWDWWIANQGVSGLAYAATKYVCRWREKGGIRDLEKAVHYVEKMEEAHTQQLFPVPWPKPHGVDLFTRKLQTTYNLSELEEEICRGLITYHTRPQLRCIQLMIKELIKKASAEAEATAYHKHL